MQFQKKVTDTICGANHTISQFHDDKSGRVKWSDIVDTHDCIWTNHVATQMSEDDYRQIVPRDNRQDD